MEVRIPFDSLTLAAVVREMQAFVGGKVQKVVQPDEANVFLEIYHRGTDACLLLSCDARYARAHLVERRARNRPEPLGLCQALRARIDGGRIDFVRQVRFDRIIEIGIDGPLGPHVVVAELMGKHSNLILVDPQGKVVSAAKVVGASKSVRPVLPNHAYAAPPFAARQAVFNAPAGANLKEFEGASPFLLKLAAASGEGFWPDVKARVRDGRFEAYGVAGCGAYPISVLALGLPEHPRPSLSLALEQHFSKLVRDEELDQRRQNLKVQLERVQLAREVAIADLELAADAAGRAREVQLLGELVLAYGASIPEGASVLEAWDYEGNPVQVKLNPELGFQENAQRYFQKAKRAKAGAAQVAEQLARMRGDLDQVRYALIKLETAASLAEIDSVKEIAEKARWLHRQPVAKGGKEDRPFDGHRVRELAGPKGYTVLYGENAESNDYLTLRVARPNDLWLHVRGATSAHVVIQTRNQPDRVPSEVLLYAAKIAVQNSSNKHSRYVPVDYTLKKYVRRPKGGAKGSVLYSHEKTLHVD